MGSLFVNNFYIYHFKKIKETQFECGPINIFTGANNSGKSSVLTAIHFFYSIWQATISENKRKPRIDPTASSNTSYIKHGINFTHSTSIGENELLFLPTANLEDIAYSSLTYKSSLNNSNNSRNREDFIELHEENLGLRISLNNKKAFSLDLTQKKIPKIQDEILSFYAPGLSGIPYEEIHYGSRYVQNQAIHFGTAGNVLRNILWRIWQDNKKREAFLVDIYAIYQHERDKTILKIIAPSAELSTLKSDDDVNPLLEFKVEIPYDSNDGKANSKLIPLNQMGVGFLQVMQILAYKHLYQPKVMLLDEPEIHLHGTLIKKLFKVLEGWAQDEVSPTQIFISTHSQTVLNYLLKNDTPKELYKLFNVQNGEVIPKDIDAKTIEIILNEDLGETIPNFSKKLVIVTEDQNQIINKLHCHAADLEVYSSKGPKQLEIAKEIRQKNKHVNILIHVDLDKEAETNNKITNEKHDMTNIELWVTDYATIEGYWLQYENLKKMIEINYGTVDADVLDEIIKGSEFNKYTRSEFARLKKLPQTTTAEDIITEFSEGLKNVGTSKDILEFYLNKSKEFCHKDSGIGTVVKNILNKVLCLYKNQLSIQCSKDTEYPSIDCPSLTQKIQELLDK